MEEGSVAIVILCWNSRQYLPDCIESVLAQTYPAIELLISDNASSDGSPEYVKEHFPGIRLIENACNLGYAAGHNRAIVLTQGEYVLLLNPDVRLQPDYVARLVEAMDADRRIGIMQGKLLSAKLLDEVLRPDGLIDSAGVWVSKTRRNGDRGIGRPDVGQYDREEDVFGAAGAAALYRRALLEDIRLDGEYFDETFFAYREEVDLAWRAQWRGWHCRYVPGAIAYHARSYTPGTRGQQPVALRRLQYRNRYLMLVKNDALPNILYHLPYLAATELAALGYVLLKERELLPCYLDVLRLAPRMLRKRRAIMASRRVSSREMRRWFR
jgi:GT2 family glycosyltransferase